MTQEQEAVELHITNHDAVPSAENPAEFIDTNEVTAYSDKNQCRKCWAVILFVWNLFNFVTDILAFMQWIMGFEATQTLVQENCAQSKNDRLLIFGLISLICSIIGFTCYLYDTYKENISSKSESSDKITWRWYEIFKLFIEDLTSVSITIYVSASIFGITVLSSLSLIVSIITLIYDMVVYLVYTPYKNGQGTWTNKGAVLCCCIFMFLVILSVGAIAFLVVDQQNSLGGISVDDNGVWIIMIEQICD